ncbi:MAG: universal stress protein [Cyclobacteriaceae bacterium]|nr:universal stress protein [Cyclobacteriaceae bacterium]
MKNLLVPSDFSKTSLNAFKFAIDTAAISGGKVHVVHVIELPAMPNSALTPVQAFGAPLRREMAGKAKANYDKLTANCNPDQVPCEFSVEFGAPSKSILSYVKKNKIDLIVMGSHGAEGLKEYFVGSNAEKIVRTSPVPVIVVKSFYKGPVKNIVVPFTLDQENYPNFFINIKALQKFFKAHLHFLWVNTPANFTLDEVTYNRIEGLAKKYKIADYSIDIYNQLYEEQGILKFAEATNADMIAMGTHGRKGIAHMVYGSKTENVANHGKTLIWTSVMN